MLKGVKGDGSYTALSAAIITRTEQPSINKTSES